MKIATAQLNSDQLAALPRTTRWRAEKRGWLVLDYHVRLANVRVLASPQFEGEAAMIYCHAVRCVRYARLAGWPFAADMDDDDLIQECVIELWRCSAKQGFASEKWRGAVIFNHLRKLRTDCRGDRDNFKRENYERREEEQ